MLSNDENGGDPENQPKVSNNFGEPHPLPIHEEKYDGDNTDGSFN